MNNLRRIFSLVASLPVVYENKAGDDVTVTGIDLLDMRGQITAAELPKRIIEPIGKVTGQTNKTLVIGGCQASEVTWQIQDGFFLRPIGIGGNVADASADLVGYMDAYIRMMPAINDALQAETQTRSITLESIEIDPPNVFAYPMLGQSEYFGVVARLTFKEFI